jgi:hypothetical protein
MLLFFLPFATNAQDYQKAAEDHCRCFQPLSDSVSSTTKDILIKASNGNNLMDSLKSQLRWLPVDTQRKFKNEFEKMTQLLENDDNPVALCMSRMEDKYRDIYVDETGPKVKRLIKEIRARDCQFLAAFMVMAIQWIENEKD